jgi:hypothetical protein
MRSGGKNAMLGLTGSAKGAVADAMTDRKTGNAAPAPVAGTGWSWMVLGCTSARADDVEPPNGAARSAVRNEAVTGDTASRSRAVTVMRAKALPLRGCMQKLPEKSTRGRVGLVGVG